MNYMQAYRNAQNLIRHSGSPINLREGLSALADAYLLLMDELERTRDQLDEARGL